MDREEHIFKQAVDYWNKIGMQLVELSIDMDNLTIKQFNSIPVGCGETVIECNWIQLN